MNGTSNNPGGSAGQPTDLAKRVADIVSEIYGGEIADETVDLADLGMDSMALLEILAALEEHFHITLHEDTINAFQTIGHITRIVGEAVRANPVQ